MIVGGVVAACIAKAGFDFFQAMGKKKDGDKQDL